MYLLRPVRDKLLGPLSVLYRDTARRDVERSLATQILADFAGDNPRVLAELLIDADDQQFAVIYPKFREHAERGLPVLTVEIERKLLDATPDDAREKLAKRQANAAVALLRMNQPERVWPLLRHSPDPRVRSYLIHRLAPLGADAGAIIQRFDEESDLTIRRALILSLGEYGEQELPPAARNALLPKLQTIFCTETDPGLHAASEWLLRTWMQEAWLQQVTEEWVQDKQQREQRLERIEQQLEASRAAGADSKSIGLPAAPPRWYVNGQGQTMVVIPGPVEFVMGSPVTEAGRQDVEIQHRRRIGRSFALAAKSVTVEEYRRFEKEYSLPPVYTRMPGLPAVAIDWYRGAKYCNWLSEQEGLPAEQWCYEISGNEVKLTANYLSLSGYRLPTEAEIEYATRSGTLTARYFGETDELLPRYARYNRNSQEKTWPVGSLKPNDFGFFDMQGNVWNWCQEAFAGYPRTNDGEALEDKEGDLVVANTVSRVLRGGSFYSQASIVRSANRINPYVPTFQNTNNGFRPARTLPPLPLASSSPTSSGAGRK
jgi:formylglycine-generating enzyme required for sulfatase activity